MSLRRGHGMPEWESVVAPVDGDNTARLREIVAQHGWPGHELVGEAGAHAAWLLAQHAPEDVQEECLAPAPGRGGAGWRRPGRPGVPAPICIVNGARGTGRLWRAVIAALR